MSNQSSSSQNQYWLSGEGIQTLGIAVIAVIGMAFALSLTKSIMIPFVLSLFMYFILSPLKVFFKERLKMPDTLALLATFSVVGLLLTLVFFVLFSAIQELSVGYKAYEARAVFFTDTIQAWLIERGVKIESFSLSSALRNLPFTQLAKGAGYGVLNLISTIFLVSIFLIFLFTGKSKSVSQSSDYKEIWTEVDAQVRKYLSIKLLTSSVTALIVFVIYAYLGLDLAFLFGLLVFVLNFIPTVGSMVATVLPLPVAFFQYDSLSPIVLVLVLPGLVQFVVGNLLEPKLMGQRLNMHPVTVLMSLMFWTLIWGVVGAFLAVPITAIIKIVLLKIEGGNIIAKIMSGEVSSEV